jgi:hypothetical protein
MEVSRPRGCLCTAEEAGGCERLAPLAMTEASGEPRAVVVHGGPSRGRHGGRVLLLLLLFPPVPVETG